MAVLPAHVHDGRVASAFGPELVECQRSCVEGRNGNLHAYNARFWLPPLLRGRRRASLVRNLTTMPTAVLLLIIVAMFAAIVVLWVRCVTLLNEVPGLWHDFGARGSSRVRPQ